MKATGTRFDEFWAIYPLRVGRLDALRQWAKVKAEEIPAILAGVERWKLSDRWRSGFIMEARRFLRGRYWEDEVPISPLQRELRVGQGPICNDVPLKPEVLARIRKREEAQRMKAKTCQ